MGEGGTIQFGVCVGPGDRFDRLCRPHLERLAVSADRMLTVRGATSIFSAYNEMIDRALDGGAQALVLLHDDVSLHDRNLLPRIRRRLREPGLGVIGVIGGRGLHSMKWGDARVRIGRVEGPFGVYRLGPLRGEVDVVDGLLMVLTREAMTRVRFDDATYHGFHGYDADYCLAVRKAGLRVVTEPIDLVHHSDGDPHGEAYEAARVAFAAKWAGTLERRPLAHRNRLASRAVRESHELARLAAPLARRLGDDVARASRLLRPGDGPRPAAPHTDDRREPDSGDVTSRTGAAAGGGPPECPVCGGPTDPEAHLTLGSRSVHRCARCGLGVTWPRPTVAIETDEIFRTCYRGARLEERRTWDRAATARLAWIEAHRPDGLLLEVGSATGEQLLAASTHGFEAYGVEPSRWAAAQARAAGADVVTGTIDDWRAEYDGMTVDAVAMFHVLEHLPDPVDALRRLRELTVADGRLFVEVPDAGSPRAQAADPSWPHWQLTHHVTHLTAAGLSTLLVDAGWEPLEVSPTSMRPYLTLRAWDELASANRRAGRTRHDADLLRAVARPRAGIDRAAHVERTPGR